MKILFDRVCLLCDEYDIDLRELEKRSGLSRHAIDKWQTGSAFIESIAKVADYFDVSIDYLAGKTENPKSHKNAGMLAQDNDAFLGSLAQLTESAQTMMQHLDNYRSYLADKNTKEKTD